MIFDLLENDLQVFNPDELLDDYCEVFKRPNNKLSEKVVKIDEEYFRARIGNKVIKCAIDDCNIEYSLPFFRDEIAAPIPLISREGRFNKNGCSYLYLASDIKTACAEVKLEVGQIASVGKFRCIQEEKYVDLTVKDPDDFMIEIKNKLLMPIHNEIKHKYIITQFISDIFKKLGYFGIIYDSTVTNGTNIVAFKPNHFKFIDYSDELYTPKKIEYTIEKIDEDVYENMENELNTYNEYEEEEKQRLIDYIVEKNNRLTTAST
jgi:RES domain-containing protein